MIMNTSIYLTLSLRLLAAFLFGGVIGIERDYRSKDAGFRTHFLVSVGAALFTILSVYGFSSDTSIDSSRVAAQIVSGVGFLGAGLIIFQRNMVRGLTTAAGIWVTAAIGMACGVGMYWLAAIVTIIVLLGLEVVNGFIPRWGLMRMRVSFTAVAHSDINRVMEELHKHEIQVYSFEQHDRRTSQGEIFEVNLELKMRDDIGSQRLIELLKDFDDVSVTEPE